jgi:SAM-dependent methyltransferase
MSHLATELLRDIEPYIARVGSSPEVAAAITKCGQPDAAQLLSTYLNEVRVGLQLIAPLLDKGLRVLEVGSGIGALARFLVEHDIDAVGIEPGAAGFGFMPELSAAILELQPAMSDSRSLPISAEELNPADHGHFDLIYSTNVMEHIPNLDGAFCGMASVLAPKGTMVHLCPNYFIPYDPHFGIPLLPGRPRATERIFPQTVKRLPGVWDDLNFITAHRVKRLAKENKLAVTFDAGVLSRALRRFDEDESFRQRQGWIAGVAQRMIARSGMIGVLAQLPGEYATPMIMRMTHAVDGRYASGDDAGRSRDPQ